MRNGTISLNGRPQLPPLPVQLTDSGPCRRDGLPVPGMSVEKLELNPDYQLVSYEMPEKPSEHLSSSLGELFAGMELKLA